MTECEHRPRRVRRFKTAAVEWCRDCGSVRVAEAHGGRWVAPLLVHARRAADAGKPLRAKRPKPAQTRQLRLVD